MMKKVLLFLLLAFTIFVSNVLGQQGTPQFFDTVSITVSEKTVVPIYSYSYDGMKNYEGAVVGFIFNVANYTDTLASIIFEGGYKLASGTITYTPIDTLTELSSTKPYCFYQTEPVFQYYRLRVPFVTGDNSTLKNIIYFEKFKTLK